MKASRSGFDLAGRNKWSRRSALQLAAMAAGSPLLAQNAAQAPRPPRIIPPTYSDEVMAPDFSDALENARRRALLFIRHGRLWRELPEGTEWYEVELTPADLQRVRVFPRAQWRKLARGNFAITDVVHGIAQGDRRYLPEAKFLAKIDGLGEQIRQGTAPGAVLLIGLNENGPFTILDGNHRLVSAMLISAQAFRTLRFFCGLSPKMTNCCWYATNLATLFRYGTKCQ